MRHTTFRFALDPTPAQERAFVRHAGASRFAYNQSLRLMTDALVSRRTDPSVVVPRSGFDLINTFNAWKKTEEAGRIFVVAPDKTVTKLVTGLAWRHEVAAQVFEEAAVDLSRALATFLQGKAGSGNGRQMGFPQPKRKGRCRESFRLRNKRGNGAAAGIRVGGGHPRSVTLPTIGRVRVHDDTRRLRRLLRPVVQMDTHARQSVVAPRARVLFATVSRHGSRWYVSLNVQAPDLHANRRHRPGPPDHIEFVGVDLGLAAFAVAATSRGPRSVDSRRQSHLPGGSAGFGSAHGHCLAPSRAHGIEPGPSVPSPESTPGLLAYGETSSTRRPATLPSPTSGWPSRTS
jgi:putative transposase